MLKLSNNGHEVNHVKTQSCRVDENQCKCKKKKTVSIEKDNTH